MDWNAIWQDVISSTISGVLVIIFGGIIAWFAYITGIKGKEKDQKASERKNEIYIPLKYELKSLIRAPSDIWKELKVTEIEKIVEKNDELVVYMLPLPWVRISNRFSRHWYFTETNRVILSV